VLTLKEKKEKQIANKLIKTNASQKCIQFKEVFRTSGYWWWSSVLGITTERRPSLRAPVPATDPQPCSLVAWNQVLLSGFQTGWVWLHKFVTSRCGPKMEYINILFFYFFNATVLRHYLNCWSLAIKANAII